MTVSRSQPNSEPDTEAERKKREAEKKRDAEFWGPHGLRINGQPVKSVNKDSYL